jgi:hypothetical protein
LRRTTVRSDDDPPRDSAAPSQRASSARGSTLEWILAVILFATAPIYGHIAIVDDVCFGDVVLLTLFVLKWGSIIYRARSGRERQMRDDASPIARTIMIVVVALIAVAFVLFGLYELASPREMTQIAGKVSGVHHWSLGLASLALAALLGRLAVLVHREAAAR